MADISDVEIALVDQIVAALYPSGSAADSAVGTTCRIYRGWPTPGALNADLTAGLVNVTVYPAAKPDDCLDLYLDRVLLPPPAANLTSTVVGQSVVFSGAPKLNDLVGLLVDNVSYVYRAVANDTAASVAANLSELISADRPALYSGTTISVPGAVLLIARVAAMAAATEVRRRLRREVQVSCWCPNPLLRDSVSKIVDTFMIGNNVISLSDGTECRIRYATTQIFDQSQNVQLFRRDLAYNCEFCATVSTPAPVMIFGDLVRGAAIATV